MIRFALVIVCILPAACFKSHPAGQREFAGDNCYACHQADYEITATPVHLAMPKVFSTGCESCHRTAGWQPALEGAHNESFFFASGPHARIACQDCHDLATGAPSKQGANTNCLGCHPDDRALADDHAGVTLFAGMPYSYLRDSPSFCLECHPSGVRSLHPDDEFARTGNHAVACSACHDRAFGPDSAGVNVTCVEARCHHTVRETDDTDGHKDGDYQDARGDGSDRTFCRECH
jgi:hypothetical protein